MPELERICGKIEKETADLREKAGARPWGNYSRRSFIYNLENILPGMEELRNLIAIADSELGKNPEPGRPETAPLLSELEAHITVLKRNLELEEKRLEKTREKGIEGLADSITSPELYSDLEQKTLGLLLKSAYLTERLRVFARKKSPLMNTKAAQRNVLDLLEKREDEIAALKKKYEETRKKSFLGLVEKEHSIETEQELNEIARELAKKTALMKKSFDSAKDAFEQFRKQITEAEERIVSVEDLEAQLTGKTFELITMLKKERDYLKKVLIDIEQDTLQLRNTYSKELLGLHEEKISMRNELDEKYSKETDALRKELAEKSELAQSLREMASRRERKLAEAEEKIDRLGLENAVLRKHGAAKEKFLEKEKKKSAAKKTASPRKKKSPKSRK